MTTGSGWSWPCRAISRQDRAAAVVDPRMLPRRWPWFVHPRCLATLESSGSSRLPCIGASSRICGHPTSCPDGWPQGTPPHLQPPRVREDGQQRRRYPGNMSCCRCSSQQAFFSLFLQILDVHFILCGCPVQCAFDFCSFFVSGHKSLNQMQFAGEWFAICIARVGRSAECGVMSMGM